ncbi:MAG TPA: DMT family transporter, partial [Anaeromyxobacteraceae bacterium]|nr:DMT family transporter [Anaeromyxobacteraceae bacterium]
MAELALLVLTAFWGTTFTLVKWALEISTTSLFLAVRFATAAAVLGAVALLRRRPVGPGFWRHGLLLGLFMLTGFVLQTLGLHLTTPARSGFITGMSVLVVPIVARLVLGRHVRRSAWGGAALAVVGLALLTRPFDAGAVTAEVRTGDLLTAGCAVAFALQIIYMSEWSSKHPLVPFTLLQISVVLAGALLMLPVEGLRFDAARAGEYAGIVAFTGVVMTAFAFFVMNWAQRHTTAVRAALIYALEPVAAAIFSWLVIDEQLGLSGWTGGGLIVLGVVAGELGGVLEARGEASRAGET